MNNKITNLLSDLNTLENKTLLEQRKIKEALQGECNKIFDNDDALQKALNNAEDASEYSVDEYGEIYSWFRYLNLADIDENIREYLDDYVAENRNMSINWENECIQLSQGESLILQDDSRSKHDNGIWFNRKCVINESEYCTEDNEVNEDLRNELIEKYMERTGYFPGVFRVTQHGDVYNVNTQKRKVS